VISTVVTTLVGSLLVQFVTATEFLRPVDVSDPPDTTPNQKES
jgi:hypothetical protein